MSILARLAITGAILTAGGFSIGMLWGLYLEQKQHYIKINKIKIKDSFKETTPSGWKMQKRWEYYMENGSLYSPIVLDKNNCLVDGYISYLIAEADGMKEVEVIRR